MPPITHQSIADRIAQTYREEAAERRKAAAPFEKERESLREACGGLGHVWVTGSDLINLASGTRHCAICGARER